MLRHLSVRSSKSMSLSDAGESVTKTLSAKSVPIVCPWVVATNRLNIARSLSSSSPTCGRREGSPCQHCLIKSQHSGSQSCGRSGLRPSNRYHNKPHLDIYNTTFQRSWSINVTVFITYWLRWLCFQFHCTNLETTSWIVQKFYHNKLNESNERREH